MTRDRAELKPTIWIGKRGITPAVLEEIVQQLRAREIVKIRFLRNAPMETESLEKETGGRIVLSRGRIVIIEARRR